MDKRGIIGVILIFLVLIVWQYLVVQKGTQKQGQEMRDERQEMREEGQETREERRETREERIVGASSTRDTVETKLFRVVLTRVGASIVSLQLKKHEGLSASGGEDLVELIPENRRAFQDVITLNNEEFYLGNEIFNLVEQTGSRLVYEIAFPDGIDNKEGSKAQKIYEFSDSSYIFDLSFDFPNSQQHDIILNSGLASTEKNKQMEFRYFGGVASLGKTVVVKSLQKLDTIPKGDQGNIDWVGVKNKYFLAAIIPLCETEAYEMKKFAFGSVGGGCACMLAPVTKDPNAIRVGLNLSTRPTRETRDERQEENYRYKIYIGPLDYDLLSKTGHNLQEACYLGFKFIRPVSRLFLKVFTGLHNIIPNYGAVIIVFSFLISVVFFPLTRISHKSALSMQKMQPKIQELQKKYKENPKKLNPAMMELYRKEGVSPVSGCLPLFIQMPVFFALYAVLDTAIVLRNAVFIPGWIENLSQPDPYFALPIAMGAMMFLQQKLQAPKQGASTQMAQQQKMMMYFMPIMFVVIFLRFPAGLVLYWSVYNIFSIVQTYVIKKTM